MTDLGWKHVGMLFLIMLIVNVMVYVAYKNHIHTEEFKTKMCNYLLDGRMSYKYPLVLNLFARAVMNQELNEIAVNMPTEPPTRVPPNQLLNADMVIEQMKEYC